MGIRIVARIRPQQKSELDKDVIVNADRSGDGSLIKIPNPKNQSETFSFQFSGVYDNNATQQDLFDHESRLSLHGRYAKPTNTNHPFQSLLP